VIKSRFDLVIDHTFQLFGQRDIHKLSLIVAH
jgi:hypothetical protein